MLRNAEYVMTRINDPLRLAKPAQVGVDITVHNIKRIEGVTTIYKDGSREAPLIIDLEPSTDVFDTPNEDIYWFLYPGAYLVEFDQGLLNLAKDEFAYIIQRSSLNRSGVRLVGSIYDPGFGTDTLGATMYVIGPPIRIYQHARVAQLLIGKAEESSLYDGQYQGRSN